MNKKDEEVLKLVERKTMRTRLGPNTTGEGQSRLKIKHELGGEIVTMFIKAQRLKWAGRIMRNHSMEVV